MKAKKIRQNLKAMGINATDVVYRDITQRNGNITRILDNNCGRAIYQQAKRGTA
jgi:hypothetical protein